MTLNKILLSTLLVTGLTITSCSNDDIAADDQTNNYSVPATYAFERNATTSVDFSGQSSRLLMLEEMGAIIKEAATNGNEVSQSLLSQMYSNTNNAFKDASLNTSGKQLKDKTAASKDYFQLFLGGGSTTEKLDVQSLFETQLNLANLASLGATASAGIAGVYLDGNSKRLFAANGLEPQQVILKGLMGAVFIDQTVNGYLSKDKLDGGTNKINNTNKIVAEGKTYTDMEHFWDEGYGYIYGVDGTKFWSSYIDQVNADVDFNTVKLDIQLAFRTGRAAIVANDYVTRDAQIDIIKTKLALVPAVRAVYYLQEGKGKLTIDRGAKAFHGLSEAYGFILSLRYTNKPGTDSPYFTKLEVDAMLNSMISGTNGLWDIDKLAPKLDILSEQIAARFGFTVAQAAAVN
jgi:hypothetical protein